MTLVERITTDIHEAQKARASTTVDALRLLQSALKNQKIELQRELTDEDALAVIRKEVKKRKEAEGMYHAAGREDLAATEAREIALYAAYLPAELSDEQVQQELEEAIAALSEADRKNMGAVMKAAKQKFGTRVDGSRIAPLVKQLLN